MSRIDMSLSAPIILLTMCLLILGGQRLTAADPAEYQAGIEEWHRQRAASLTSETGWLSLIGLFWLEEGDNTFGSSADRDIVLPETKSPPHAGTLNLQGGRVHLRVAGGTVIVHEAEPVTDLDLAVDTTGHPTILDLGDLQFYVIERAGRFGLRIRDRQHPARFEFSGIEAFPIDPQWRLTGRLETHDPPRTIKIPNVLGQVTPQPSPGTAVFEVAGAEYHLDALAGPNDTLYLIFADQTSGRDTYGGGRFLYSEPVAADGSVVLDFNKAYNPPCAFTDYATCPLPPRQNKLSVRIDAGEKSYGRQH